MKLLAYAVIAAVLSFAGGFAAGHHWDSISQKAGQTTAAHAQTKAVVAGVNKQAVAQHAAAVVEQGKTLALNSQLDGIQNYGMNLQKEIQHAVFIPYAVPGKPVVVACSEPDASAEFVRLYNAAASGYPATAASAGTSGMHFLGLSKVPARTNAAAWQRHQLVAARP